ncbi:hypothetical protein BV509_02415 [Rhodovulum sulfidophilum]|uniref:Uncharacterized protein n=1 Tax=Rhodovulum visakhapatnamense TaxID=364297 RepID=A0ABS1RDH5_9RHOB|nr:hypothetical protein [Rhodovulum visakhapatnamense]MBL3570657.1 hypothetical protein [Rhodovulum visakhapatnamense]MBL3577702.1 hypothetical protein [Rhodovulum visakhapatnamense]OLS43302.1 hypothetical protein BV509_02415 [Rhodovulum sulfidophilum]
MAHPPDPVLIAAFTLRQKTSGALVQSPYSLAQTAYDFMGEMWAADLTLTHVDMRGNARIEAWLASLRGTLGTFEMAPPDYEGPYGVMSANPTVAATADARARTLTITVPPGSAAGPGDYLTIAGHLHLVIEAAAPDLARAQTLSLWPRLRAPVAPGAAVEMLKPYGTWRRASAEVSFDCSQDRIRSRTLSLIEAL